MTLSFHRRNRRPLRLKEHDYAQPGAYFVTICTQHRQRLFGEVVSGEMLLNDAGRMIQRIWDEIPFYYKGIDIDAFVVMPDHIHGLVVVLPPGSPVSPVGAIPPWLPPFEKTWLPPFKKTESPVSNKPYFPPSRKSALPQKTDLQSISHPTCDLEYLHDFGNEPCPKNDIEPGVMPCDETEGDHVFLNDGDHVFSNKGDHGGIAPTGMTSLSDVVRCFKTLTTKRYIDAVHHQNWPPFPGKLWQRNYYEHIIRDDVALTFISHYIANNPMRWTGDP